MKTYAIHWKSAATGTIGTGTKRFEKEEAEHLAAELNETYPEIHHEAVIPAPVAAEAPVAAPTGPQNALKVARSAAQVALIQEDPLKET